MNRPKIWVFRLSGSGVQCANHFRGILSPLREREARGEVFYQPVDHNHLRKLFAPRKGKKQGQRQDAPGFTGVFAISLKSELDIQLHYLRLKPGLQPKPPHRKK
jgi:hypothetical protein